MTHAAARDPDALDCGSAMDQLFDFLDGELGPETESRVRAHLEACGHCFEQAGFEKRFLDAVEAARATVTCPGALRARVLGALRRDGWVDAAGS